VERYSCPSGRPAANLSLEYCNEALKCLISRCPNFHCNGKIIFKSFFCVELGGPCNRGPLGLCPSCPPHCYATVDKDASRCVYRLFQYAGAAYAVIVCPSVRPSHAGILSKRMNGSSGFRHGGFLPPVLRCVIRKSGIFSKAVNLLGLLKLSVKKVENRSTFSKVIRHRIAACVFNVYLTHSAFDVSFVTESKMQKHNAIKTF